MFRSVTILSFYTFHKKIKMKFHCFSLQNNIYNLILRNCFFWWDSSCCYRCCMRRVCTHKKGIYTDWASLCWSSGIRRTFSRMWVCNAFISDYFQSKCLVIGVLDHIPYVLYLRRYECNWSYDLFFLYSCIQYKLVIRTRNQT